jgi:all-trans-retinol 13,14-reductase
MQSASRYKSQNIKESYDYIVIGSGVGGLALASFLGHLGHQVLVLEQHYLAGGLTHTFKRSGFKWDVGVHYVGELHNGNSNLKKLFDFLTNGQLQWSYIGPVSDRVIFGDDQFVDSYSLSEPLLIKRFPEDEPDIRRYFKLNREIYESSSRYFMLKAFPQFLFGLVSSLLSHKFKAYSFLTGADVLEQTIKNKTLRAVLASLYGDYGLAPHEVSYSAHAIVSHHYSEGGSYPIGGSDQIAKTMIAGNKASNVQVFTCAKVQEILIEDNCAVGVKMDNGDNIRAKKVVINAGYYSTFVKLLDKDYRPSFISELTRLKPSKGFFCVYLGLSPSVPQGEIPLENVWIYPDEDIDGSYRKFDQCVEEELSYVFVSCHSARDPSYNGKHTVTLLTSVDISKFDQWQDSKWGDRPDSYHEFKKELEGRVLKVFFSKFPSLKSKVEFMESSTPLSHKHFNANTFGEPYGLGPTPKRFSCTWLKPKSPIKGLYTVGADNIMGGIAPALISAAQCLIALHPIRGLRLILKILGKKNSP